MNEKLKPCPFCGNDPVYYHDKWGVWSVDCDLCDVTGPRSETKEGAAIDWNRRDSGMPLPEPPEVEE